MPSVHRLPKEVQLAISKLEESQSTNFCELVKLAGLDPSKDFRFTNLSGTDFSQCNLRGYDFSGADLTGCYGTEIEFDDSTMLDDADVEGSCFEYFCSRKEFFRKNEKWNDLLQRLASAHFTSSVNWIADNLGRSTTHKDGPWYVASRLLEVTEDSVVRSNIIFFALPMLRKSNEHLDFLFHILANKKSSDSLVRTAAFALASAFAENQHALEAMMKLLRHSDYQVRREAIRGLCNSSQFWNLLPAIVSYVSRETSSENRRYFLMRLCARLQKKEGGAFVVATLEPGGKSKQIDFQEPVSRELVEKIARNWITSDKFGKSAEKGASSSWKVIKSQRVNSRSSAPAIYEDELAKRKQEVLEVIENLRGYGLPFVVQ